MKRREFLKAAASISALAAEGILPGGASSVLAGARSDGPPARAYSLAPPGALDRASFDIYVEHKTLLVASTDKESDRRTEFSILLRPIRQGAEGVVLSTVPIRMPLGFHCAVTPNRVSLSLDPVETRCIVTAPEGAPEGAEALFKVVARRGEEEQEVTLRVKVITAAPHWSLGKSKDKVEEQPLKVTAGPPARFRLSLGNRGRLEDVFFLEVEAPEGWTARLADGKGRTLERVRVGPVRGLFQWEYPEEIWLEATPGPTADRKKTVPVVARARSERTGAEHAMTVHAFLCPPLFSVNDMEGLDPRIHYVKAGASTTYVLHLFNPVSSAGLFHLSSDQVPPGWSVDLSATEVHVTPRGHEEVTVSVRPPASATKGERRSILITARTAEGESLGTVCLEAEIYDLPKIYLLVIDSLDYKYLSLNRSGDGPGQEGDWLCPRIREFMKHGASFSNARCGMPAATDMNHTTIMSGAMTGDLGAYWVSGLYAGLDPVGDILVVRPNPGVLRYGPKGRKLTRIFDMVKVRYPSARSVVVSNKAWVSRLHEDGEAVRWGITGSHFPVYAPAPGRFVLGDPPSDPDPDDRRPVRPPSLMVNLNPLDLLPQIIRGDWELLEPILNDVGEFVGSKPGFFPDDKWIADRARQVIREEDPEVLYVNLAAVDDAGHLFGAAWNPDEWRLEKGLLGSRWVNRYSEQARRGDILDVIREADLRFGEIIDEIRSRGMLEHAIIVFAADHSMITEGYRKQGYAALDLREYLRSQGIISPKHYGTAWSLNHYAAIFDVRDENTLREIKRQLQGMAVDDPEEGKGFHPCIVLDREGMKAGMDQDNPYLSLPDKVIAAPMELYSAYYIENPAAPGERIRWPDLFVFFRGRYQGTVPGDALAKGVNGAGQKLPVLRKTGSRWVGVHGSRGTTHVPLVFSGPSVKEGIEIGEPASLHDILPTLCRMLGWPVPETAAGKAQAEILA